jgi:hypothetical protein
VEAVEAGAHRKYAAAREWMTEDADLVINTSSPEAGNIVTRIEEAVRSDVLAQFR